MKIRITFTVDIDPDAWTLAYGTPRDEIRADVQTYIEEGMRTHLADELCVLMPEKEKP